MPDIATVIAAWKSTGTRLAARPDERQEEDWHAAGEVLAGFHGHGGHGGWAFTPWTQETLCRCGRDLFETAAGEGVLAA